MATRLTRNVKRQIDNPRPPIRRPLIIEIEPGEGGGAWIRIHEKGCRFSVKAEITSLFINLSISSIERYKTASGMMVRNIAMGRVIARRGETS